MNRKLRHKLWLDRRSRKLQNKKHGGSGRAGSKKKSKGRKEFRISAPSIFSFVENVEETAYFFNDIIDEMAKNWRDELFFFDSSSVSTVTADALIYIIAILNNIKYKRVLKYSFKGNFPQKGEALEQFIRSGFVKYVKTNALTLPKTNDSIQIRTGQKADTAIAREVCDFVADNIELSYHKRAALYTTLIELMSNTFHHAFSEKNRYKTLDINCVWYLYAEMKTDRVQVTFVDIGAGIPMTIKKRFFKDFFSEECDYLYAAFTEKQRSETGEKNRGHGLPNLYEKVRKGDLLDFRVLSGRAECRYDNDFDSLERIRLKNHVHGTVYRFEVS